MRQIPAKFTLIICSLVFFSCIDNSEGNTDTEDNSNQVEKIYSTSHFDVFEAEDYYILEISNAFQNFDGRERYVFYPESTSKPEVKNVTHYFATPINKITISSTTHLGYLNALDKREVIVGAKALKYAYDQEFIDRLNSGEVVNLGEQTYNMEKLFQLQEAVNLGYAIDASTYKELQQLRKKGERFILIAEYMEQNPISKAKWLLPIAMLFGEEKMHEAIDYLDALSERYSNLKSKVAGGNQKPDVMIGLPWRGSWFVSGGDSFQARFISDAGGNYLWKNIDAKASVPIDIEKVFHDALDADFWINPGAAKSIGQIIERDARFKKFKPIKTGRVYNQNKRLSSNGGNDYWESAVVHPDLVLKDLIAIFYPEHLKNHELYYYQRLNP